MTPLLDIRDLTIAFGGRRVVEGLSFQVNPGETVAVVGESGSGKSVTALAMMGLLGKGGAVVGGQILWRQETGVIVDLAASPEADLQNLRGKSIAMVFQEPMTSLNPLVSIGDQIAEVMVAHRGLTLKQARGQARRMLELVRIPDAEGAIKRHPHQLSGGMRQRVMIAMALCCRPGLLIADEPTTALDPTVQAQILDIIRDLQAEFGMAVLFISHDMGVVAQMADRVVVMRRGALIESGPAAQVLHTPREVYTRALLAAAPRLGAMAGKVWPEPFRAEGGAAQPSIPRAREQGEPPVLSVRDLTTRFVVGRDLLGRARRRVHAVEGVSFDIDPGETLSLVGESGCGKSTIGRSVMGLVQPEAGRVVFEGVSMGGEGRRHRQPLHRGIQYVFQDPFASLDPRMAVGHSIAEPMRVHGLARGQVAAERVAALLDQVGLPRDSARRFPHEFSGGQRQRICIARALAAEPRLIIADEAVAALDVTVQAQIVDLLIDLQREMGVAYLFISHDMAVVERVSHRVAVMYLGQIVEIGPRRAIFETPEHPYTRRLIAASRMAEGARAGAARPDEAHDIPSAVRRVNDVPERHGYRQVAPHHFVAA